MFKQFSRAILILLFFYSLAADLFPAGHRFVDSEGSLDSRARLVDDYLKRANAFGFSGQILVAAKGKLLLHKSYGLANREDQKKITRKTVFNVASLSKSFTACAVLHLEQTNKLKISDSIEKYLDDVPKDKADITIDQLLKHRSGLVRNTNISKAATRDEVVTMILKRPLASKAGEKFQYSNDGYRLLAAIIEKASNSSYPAYLADHIFKPAKMTQTGFYQDPRWQENHIAYGYNEWSRVKPFTDWKKTWNHGSGSIVSTARDLHRWFSSIQKNKILSDKTRRKFFSGQSNTGREGITYGFGWYSAKTRSGEQLIYHGGDNYGYHSELRWFTEKDVLLVVLTNNESFDYINGAAVQKRIIANNIYRILSGDEYQNPPRIIKKKPKALRKYEGTYQFSDGAKFFVKQNADRLDISAEGQTAINILTKYEPEVTKKYDKANQISSLVIKHISNGEKEKIKEILPPSTYDFYVDFLAGSIAKMENGLGKLKSFNTQGTVSLPWNKNEYRTNIILSFEKGERDLFFGWQDGTLSDVTTEAGRPFPLIMPLAPQSETDFATYEFIRDKSVSLRFDFLGKKVNRLAIESGNGIFVARKVDLKR